jgi:CelD/BcsL family acetyltransferase involved in cellulose biosynthesis
VKAALARPTAALRGLIVNDVDALSPYLASWDALAIAAGRPFCAPSWMLSWWSEGRSGDARLRVVLVLDAAGELVGVGPFFAQVGPLRLAEYRLLAAGFSHRVGPVARVGLEEPVAAEIASALSTADPPPASVVFEGIDQRDRWPELLAAAWPTGRTRLRTDATMDAPAIDLDGDYDRWLARRERKFRKEVRRTARRLEDEGIRGRIALDEAAINALVRLHSARWSDRGGSNLGPELQRVVASAAQWLDGDRERIAIALLEGPSGPIAAELTLRAGNTLAFWAGGFDPAWARHAPGTQAMVLALEVAASQGVRTVDLGGGEAEYKHRLADTSQPLRWRTVFPPGRRYPLIRLRLAPKHLRYGARGIFRRLPPRLQGRLRTLLRRAK